MQLGNPKRGVEWEAVVEGESRPIEDWRATVVKWNPVNRELALILAGMSADNRAGMADDLSKMGDGKDEKYMQFVTNLASLSDKAFITITQAISDTEEENKKYFTRR